MKEYLLQVKSELGAFQTAFSLEDGSIDDASLERAAIQAMFNVCNGRVVGLGILQVLADGKPVMGTYFNHFGARCMKYLKQDEYQIYSILKSGAIHSTPVHGAIALESFVSIQDVLNRCRNYNPIYYDEEKYGISLREALFRISREGDLRVRVDEVSSFT